MGFFKSLFSDSALAEDTIKANEKTYLNIRKERPGEDEHFYLATTYLRRIMFWLQLKKYPREMLDMVSFAETRLFSVLDNPKSIRALSLYVLYKEMPAEAVRYEREYEELMGPIVKLEKEGKFVQLYKAKNPRISKLMEEQTQHENNKL